METSTRRHQLSKVLLVFAFRPRKMQSASILRYTAGKERHNGVATPKTLSMEPEAITANGMLNRQPQPSEARNGPDSEACVLKTCPELLIISKVCLSVLLGAYRKHGACLLPMSSRAPAG